MFDYKYLLTFCLSLIAVVPAYADTPSCVSTNCATLGYTKTAAACSGAETIKCPFDTSKVICLPKASQINTPVLRYIEEAFSYTLGYSPDSLTLDTKLDDIADGDWLSSGYPSSLCYEMDGAYGRLECDETTFELFVTVGDIVTWVEEQLMQTSSTDPCAGYVTVNSSTEICTSYCSSDSSKCMVKRAMTCDEAITKMGGTKLSLGVYKTMANTTYYLTGDISFGSSVTSLNQVIFREASELPACANDSSVTKHPKLSFTSISGIKGVNTFNVATDISDMTVPQSESLTIVASRDLRIRDLRKTASSIWNQSVTFTLYDNADFQPYDVKVGLHCEGISDYSGGDSRTYDCTTMFDSSFSTDNIHVTWCDMPNGNGKNVVTCTGAASDFCTETGDESECYF